MIVTIDGPAGSGKSTVAQRLAHRLGVAYLDTGAMYRAVTLKALQTSADLNDAPRLAALACESDIRFEAGPTGQRVFLDGQDVSAAIRTMQVNEAAALVARVPRVREVLVTKQRQIAAQWGSLVTEGRDQGSTVFPNAEVKFVLEADVAARARRRHAEMLAAGQDVLYDAVLANQQRRDRADETHWLALLESHQAVRVDTTGLDIDQVVERLYQHVVSRTRPLGRDFVPLRPWWWVCRTAVFALFWLLFKAHTVGIRRVPRSGPVILACNHQSFFDPVLATIGLRRETSYMARDTLFSNRWFGWLIRSLNAIPVKRRTAHVGALKEMMRRLRDGYVVVTFPEETRTLDGRVNAMLAGTVLLAQRVGATIVPVCIDGAYEAWPRSRPLPGPGWITVAYGEPLRPRDIRGRDGEAVAREIRRRIIELQGRVRRLAGRPPIRYDS